MYNNSLETNVAEVFQQYAQEGYVDFRQAPHSMIYSSEYTILLIMGPVINDCMYRNMYRYKKVSVL